MTARAFARAERCFALARSTTFVGERDAAIAKGTAIATAAGIDLNRFDIPGRSKSAQVKFKPTGGDFATARHAPEDYSVEEIGRLREIHLRRMREAAFSDLSDAIDAAARATGARPGETAYDAQRRNFNEACAAAKARDDRHQRSGGAA